MQGPARSSFKGVPEDMTRSKMSHFPCPFSCQLGGKERGMSPTWRQLELGLEPDSSCRLGLPINLSFLGREPMQIRSILPQSSERLDVSGERAARLHRLCWLRMAAAHPHAQDSHSHPFKLSAKTSFFSLSTDIWHV